MLRGREVMEREVGRNITAYQGGVSKSISKWAVGPFPWCILNIQVDLLSAYNKPPCISRQEQPGAGH